MIRYIVLAWLLVPAWALAKPTLAVAPIENDRDKKVVELVVEAADEEFRVIKPDRVGAAMQRLEIDTIDPKSVKKLRKRLDAEIIVYGSIDKDGKKKNLTLSISARGKRTQKFDIDYKSAEAKSFKKELRRELKKRFDEAEADASNTDEDDDDKKKSKRDDDDKNSKRDDDDKKSKRTARSDDDDGDTKVRKKRRGDDDDDGDDRPRKAAKRHVIAQSAVRVSAGLAATRRTLTNDSTAMNPPPPVGTFGAAPRIDAEIYPGAFDKLTGAAGFGLVGEYEKTVGVGITVPGSGGKVAAIDQSRLSIGARYRVAFGPHSFSAGLSYWTRQYVADRSELGATVLDMPDVAYKAISPSATLRIGTAPNLSVFFSLELPLLLDAGPIQSSMAYGPADVLAFDIEAGAEILVGTRYAMRLAAQVEQVGLSFSAGNRGVSSAADRLMGVVATFVILY